MAGEKKASLPARIRKAWAVLRGNEAKPSASWTDDDVKKLAEQLGNRDSRLLLLFCEGGRATVPGTELTTKFGCGSPFDMTRDLPQVAAFCGKRLPSPIVKSGGTADAPAYALAWTRSQARLFVNKHHGKDISTGAPAPSSMP